MRLRVALSAGAAALLLLLAHPPGALAAPSDELARSFAELQARDRYLLDVGWKLATGNAPYCADAAPAIGLLVTDMAAYGKQGPALREALDLPGDIASLAVAKGGPAQLAGIRPDAPLLALGGEDLLAPSASDAPAWQRAQRLHETIDRSLRENGKVAITWRDSPDSVVTAEIVGIPACASRFEVWDDGTRASAEGTRVIFGRDFPGFGYPEAEFAAAVAHEMAHNLLGHRAWLAENGRKRKNIRLTEREADRLMPWLLANAGYDPAAAKRFMERWGPAHGGGLLRKRTHDGWDERVDEIDAELTQIAQVRAGNGPADWATHFRREIEP